MNNSFFNGYPYTDFHELNLSWVIQELRSFATTLEQFVSINALKYADPIQWNITTQYEKNTIVIDPVSGVAYISVAPVPAGVIITNTDYWTPVFDLGALTEKAGRNLTDKYEEDTTLTATFPSNVNDWLIWGDELYRVLSPIIAGDQYVIGSNIEHFTIESILGHVEDLDTTDKTNLVAAINEVLTTLVNTTGDLDDLTTTDKTNLVAAINEIAAQVLGKIGDLDTLNTNVKTDLVSAINEVLSDIVYVTPEMFGAVGDGVTDDTAAFTECMTYPYVELSNKTYLISDTIEVHATKIKGNDTTIELDFPEWKRAAFEFVDGLNVAYISGVNMNCHDMVSVAFFVSDGTSDINFVMDECSANNMDNDVSQYTTAGVFVNRTNKYVSITNCRFEEMHKHSSNNGITNSVGIAVVKVLGEVIIANNYVSGSYYQDSDHKYDADGIACFSKNHIPTLTDEDISVLITNNVIKQCQGRFIKIQAENVKVIGNVCMNNNLDLVSSFQGIALQVGGGVVTDNRMEIIDCTGTSSDGRYIMVGTTNNDKYNQHGIITNNTLHSNTTMRSGLVVRYSPSVKNRYYIAGNTIDNANDVVYNDGNASSNAVSMLIFKNNFVDTYTRMFYVPSAFVNCKIVANDNYGTNESNMMHKDITVSSTISATKDWIDNIYSQVPEIGITIGRVTWETHGYRTYIMNRSTSTQAHLTVIDANAIYVMWHSADNNIHYYKFTGTEVFN